MTTTQKLKEMLLRIQGITEPLCKKFGPTRPKGANLASAWSWQRSWWCLASEGWAWDDKCQLSECPGTGWFISVSSLLNKSLPQAFYLIPCVCVDWRCAFSLPPPRKTLGPRNTLIHWYCDYKIARSLWTGSMIAIMRNNCVTSGFTLGHWTLSTAQKYVHRRCGAALITGTILEN